MGLADTAELLVRLKMQDDTSATAGKVKSSLGGLTTAAAAVATVGFGALTAGALQAEAAQGKFMAATGGSREEAKAFVSDMNGLAGTAGAVGMSFEDIAAAGTAVSQQFQVSGEDAKNLTSDILEFSKVTGQDATGAAMQLEDTLSAFGLEAGDAAGLMDTLVASNQRFGTDAGPATLSVLQNMAPALATMGGDLEDGTAFLNLFETAGLDAGKASVALGKAVKELKPGQTLDDLITQIGAIEDPTRRAQKAMEIFGTKSGVGLANAIKPGMTSLEDFSVSAEDAAGSVDKAADDMLTTSDRIKGIFDKLGAGARELGQEFGPAITGLASLGTLAVPFASGLSGMWGKVRESPLVKTAIGLAGGVAGTVYTATAAAAEKLLGAVSAAWNAVGAPGSSVLRAAGAAGVAGGGAYVAGLLTLGALAMFTPQIIEKLTGTDPSSKLYAAGGAAANHYIAGASDEIKATYQEKFFGAVNETLENRSLWDKLWNNGVQSAYESGAATANAWAESAGEGIRGSRDEISAALIEAASSAATTLVPVGERLGEDIGVGQMHAYAESLKARTGNVTQSFAEVITYAAQAVKSDAGNAAYQLGKAFDGDLAGALRDGKNFVSDAMDQVTWAIKHPMELTRQVAEIEGALMGQKLANALASKNPEVRIVAEQQKAILIGRWEELTGQAYSQGTAAANALERGLKTFSPVQVKAFQDIKIPDLFSGRGRAEGGPVRKGQAYIVGERHAEWFVPHVDGEIVPTLQRPTDRKIDMTAMGGIQRPLNRTSEGYFGPLRMPAIDFRPRLTVELNTRQVEDEQMHYRFVQGRTG